MSLPEAQDRPRAAVKLGDGSYSAKSMPVGCRQVSFARRPAGRTHRNHKPESECYGRSDLKRRTELRLAALSQRADQGNDGRANRAKRMNYASKIHTETNLSLLAALEQSGCNVAAIR